MSGDSYVVIVVGLCSEYNYYRWLADIKCDVFLTMFTGCWCVLWGARPCNQLMLGRHVLAEVKTELQVHPVSSFQSTCKTNAAQFYTSLQCIRLFILHLTDIVIRTVGWFTGKSIGKNSGLSQHAV